MTKKIVATVIMGATLAAAIGAASAANLELLLSGPVDAVNVRSNTIAVLGRSIQTRDAFRVAKGQRVNVYGVLLRNGAIANAVVESVSEYVAGADPVFIKGIVTGSNSSLGVIRVGDAQIDYTGLLYSATFATPTVGEVVEFSGTQPASQGVVLASSRGARAAIMNGGGVQAEIMNGGGREAAIMNGGGVQAEIMNGGGREAAIMNGGGVQAEIMNGGGREAAIMNGGGVQAEIMNGGGREAAIMNGGGVQAEIMNGGGREAAIMNGGGVQAEIMNGGGREAAIMNGGGVQAEIMNGGGSEAE